MSAYPTYSFQQPQMNPYQNSYQPMQNPYMAQMQYQQNFQPQVQQIQQPPQIGLNCRLVDDFNAIVANDVPMDGNGAIFVDRNGTEMQWRNWTPNGTIQTIVYKPIQPENQSEATNIPQMDFNALNEDVRALREDIKGVRDMIEKSMAVPAAKTPQRGKKAEVSADE